GLGQGADSISPVGLACALLIRAECHSALRQATTLLPALVSGAQGYPILDQALYATQLSLAAWRLRQEASLVQAADVAARMLGARTLSAKQAHAGLIKLYTLKE